MSHPNAIVRLFVEEVTSVLRDCKQHAPNGRCLNATRIAIDALAAFSIQAKPLSVKTFAWNRPYHELLMTLGRSIGADDLARRPEAWAVGIDVESHPDDDLRNAWAGHLVAVVQDHLIDCAADQFSRPAHAMTFPDVVVIPGVSKRFLKSKQRLARENTIEGSWIAYEARAEDRSFVYLSGFQRHVWNQEIAAETVARMRHRMGKVA
jgi:hypothetical protein